MNIKIIKNDEIKIEEIKMNTDGIIKNLEKPLQSYGFFYMIIGGPGSGKTNLIINMICSKNKMYYKKFDTVHFWSPSRHTIGKKIKLADDRFHDILDFDELELLIQGLPKESNTLFIFDDCISSIKKNCDIFLKLIYNRRHLHISIILVSQVYNKIPCEIRKACSALMFFRNNNKKEIDTVFDDFASQSRDDFKFICHTVFKRPHDFLMIDTVHDSYYRNFDKMIISSV